jgi:predicted Rossmann fold nucleotide-binding protein DprA/Smf involved in DNA uptake
MHIDEISRQGNMEPKEVSSILTRMELKGMIRQLPGKMFVH